MRIGSHRDIIHAVQSRAWPRLKSLRSRLVPGPTKERLTAFVRGPHRSDTNMMMQMMQRSWQTDVYDEADARAFDEFILRDEPVLHALVANSAAPVVVIKALHEADRLHHLIDAFAPARAIWMYRSFEDVINSSLRRWPLHRNEIDLLVQDRDAGEWRGRGMTDATPEIIRQHYRPDMTNASATGLFWYYRNQLLFDQGLERHPGMMLVEYERLARDDGGYAERLAGFLGLELTAGMCRVAHTGSIRKHAPTPLDDGIWTLCIQMSQALLDAHQRQLVSLGTSPTSAA